MRKCCCGDLISWGGSQAAWRAQSGIDNGTPNPHILRSLHEFTAAKRIAYDSFRGLELP